MRYCSKSLRKIHLNYVSLQCSCKYTSISFAVKPIETNRPSLLWVEFGICIGRESSNVLNKICLFQKWTFSLWYSLITALTFWKRIPLTLGQYKKVCPIESRLKQKRHLSSANLYLSSSFSVVIILYTTLKVNCLSLLSFEDLHIFVHKTITPVRKFWKAFFPSLYCAGFWNNFLDEQTVTIFSAQFG